MKTKLLKSLKFLAGASFLFALVLNVIITLDDPFMFMSDVAIAQGTTGSSSSASSTGTDSGLPGGSTPFMDEMKRPCAVEIGGGGELGVDFTLTPTGLFTISIGGKFYRPTSVTTGYRYDCTLAWAMCTETKSGSCIPETNSNTTN